MSITPRVEKIRLNYVNAKPCISYERARIWTESHKRTEGKPVCIRRAQALYDCCEQLPVTIFEGEMIVGATGEFRKCGILTPEFSWKWVDKEMDNFATRPQDPYIMTEEQRKFVRENIFPYWQNQSLEESFVNQIPAETARILIDTGIIDNDSKWRQAVGETTPDYQDVIFKKGYGGIIKEAEEHLAQLDIAKPEDQEKIDFYNSMIIAMKALIVLAHRYAAKAREMAAQEKDPVRKEELLAIAENCDYVPENPPKTFFQAIQTVWFTQLGGVLSENPLALNPGRFDQYMYPYYQADLDAGRITYEKALELIELLWLKYSEWVWTISANTADYFAGYNQFQNMTIGGRTSDGKDGTNAISYMALKATEDVKTHQPGLSVRIHADCPEEFMAAVTHLVSKGTGFPAIHNDQAGYEMLLREGYDAEVAMDWSNCGCVVPHNRKAGEWTAAVNVNFGAALEYVTNEGRSRLTGEKIVNDVIPVSQYKSYEEVKDAFLRELAYLVKHSVVGTVAAQRLHTQMVPRPFLSACHEHCMESGKDLSRGGAMYNVGPVLTGIGLAACANSLAVIKKLVFEDKVTDMVTLCKALDANWEGYETLRQQAQAVPKYGNDDDYVDDIAAEIAMFYYHQCHSYKDIFGSPFNSAFMGISNYLPAGKIIGATPDGRKATEPLTEGVSPYAGTDTTTPLAAMRSAAKMNHALHSGGTLLNLRLGEELVSTKRGQNNLAAMIRSFFSLGAFHVQFNTISTETLLKAQADPDSYRDLLVRVAGYSTQFVNLSKNMQDAIIARTAHKSF